MPLEIVGCQIMLVVESSRSSDDLLLLLSGECNSWTSKYNNTYLLVGCFFRWSRDDKRTCAWSIISAQAIFCWVISLRAGLRLLLPALLCQTSKRIWEESTSYYDCIYRRQQSSSTSYVLINTWQQTFCDCGLHTLVRVLGVPIWCPVGKYRFGGIGTWIPNNRSLLPNFNFESQFNCGEKQAAKCLVNLSYVNGGHFSSSKLRRSIRSSPWNRSKVGAALIAP